jgi:hypothetical protein
LGCLSCLQDPLESIIPTNSSQEVSQIIHTLLPQQHFRIIPSLDLSSVQDMTIQFEVQPRKMLNVNNTLTIEHQKSLHAILQAHIIVFA